MVLLFKMAIALAAALAVGAAVRLLVRPAGPWSHFWTVFLLLFLSAWAAGIWTTPLAPVDWGLSIPLFAAVGFGVAAVLLLAGYPLHVPRRRVRHRQWAEERRLQLIFQLPFWIVIAALAFTILLRYLASDPP